MSKNLLKLPLLVNIQNMHAVHNTQWSKNGSVTTITVKQGDFTTGSTNDGHDRLCCICHGHYKNAVRFSNPGGQAVMRWT